MVEIDPQTTDCHYFLRIRLGRDIMVDSKTEIETFEIKGCGEFMLEIGQPGDYLLQI